MCLYSVYVVHVHAHAHNSSFVFSIESCDSSSHDQIIIFKKLQYIHVHVVAIMSLPNLAHLFLLTAYTVPTVVMAGSVSFIVQCLILKPNHLFVLNAFKMLRQLSF